MQSSVFSYLNLWVCMLKNPGLSHARQVFNMKLHSQPRTSIFFSYLYSSFLLWHIWFMDQSKSAMLVSFSSCCTSWNMSTADYFLLKFDRAFCVGKKQNQACFPFPSEALPSLRTSYWKVNRSEYVRHLAPGTHGKDDNPPGYEDRMKAPQRPGDSCYLVRAGKSHSCCLQLDSQGGEKDHFFP